MSRRRQIEERSGISEQYVSKLEAETANPSYLALVAICAAIGVEVPTLLGWAQEGLELSTRFHEE